MTVDMSEYKKRSVAKTFSWRMIATMTGGGIVFWQTGGFGDAMTFMGIEFPLKMMFYYLHERGWAKFRWGFGEQPASEAS